MAYLIIAHAEDGKGKPKLYRRDLYSEAVKLMDDINNDPNSGREAELREEEQDMPGPGTGLYTALTGKKHAPLITLLATSAMEARGKITKQLSLPGRDGPLQMWRNAHQAIRTPEGITAYYWAEIDSMVCKLHGTGV